MADEMELSLQAKAQEFESRLLKPRSSADPLHIWVEYLEWVHVQLEAEEYAALLERCVRRFYGDEQYKQDSRFVRICVTHADTLGDTRQTEQALQRIREQGIGIKSSLVYEAHAIVLEKLRNFALAETTYSKGVQNKAAAAKQAAEEVGGVSKQDASKGGKTEKERWREAKRSTRSQAAGGDREQHEQKYGSAEAAKAQAHAKVDATKTGDAISSKQDENFADESEKPISRKLAFGGEAYGRSDMTIHTRLAMEDVDAMFNSPLPFEAEEHTEDVTQPGTMCAEPAKAVRSAGFSIYTEEGHSDVQTTQEVVVNPQSAKTRAHVEDSIAEWFAGESDYHVVDAAPELTVGCKVTLGEELQGSALELEILQDRSAESCGEIYDVRTTEHVLTLKVQTPADPWELYVLRRLNSQLSTPAVPDAAALFDAESKSYLLTSHYPSLSLAAFLRQPDVDLPRVVFIFSELLSVLELVHSAGFIHTRLIPENIFLRKSGESCPGVQLVEFSRSVDIKTHPRGSTFHLASEKPWKFDRDAHGVAEMLRLIGQDRNMPGVQSVAAELAKASSSNTPDHMRLARQHLLALCSTDDLGRASTKFFDHL
eukprot:CAMPEP_0198726628 /NCGR_PEP_ID=MMETSP1475-20131203/3619_1 /TAXON_ID= ORGANISM="Unidentified sp., Strain CCMP1999" /NCGR_SAMPLE_ID=MMETSP1475 /ASSEMBLY_ACC=CAM_ASM_001111 /LENGTH=596 /DNA_ID=CAMNT_0044488569 /DNA_START=88 /DNA_END=1878 /DNA_ORIENTATION=+